MSSKLLEFFDIPFCDLIVLLPTCLHCCGPLLRIQGMWYRTGTTNVAKICYSLLQESARYRSLCVTTWIRAAAESGKKCCTSIFTSFILFWCFCFFTCFFPRVNFCLGHIIILVVFIEGIIEGFIYLLNCLAGLLLGAALSFLASSVSGKLLCHIVTTINLVWSLPTSMELS